MTDIYNPGAPRRPSNRPVLPDLHEAARQSPPRRARARQADNRPAWLRYAEDVDAPARVRPSDPRDPGDFASFADWEVARREFERRWRQLPPALRAIDGGDMETPPAWTQPEQTPDLPDNVTPLAPGSPAPQRGFEPPDAPRSRNARVQSELMDAVGRARRQIDQEWDDPSGLGAEGSLMRQRMRQQIEALEARERMVERLRNGTATPADRFTAMVWSLTPRRTHAQSEPDQ